MIYVDLYRTHLARFGVWLLSLTTQLECIYIFPNKNILYSKEMMKYNKVYDNEYIAKIYNVLITYLEKYGKIMYINSKNEIEKLMNNKDNYLFHSIPSNNYSNYNNRYIFVHHGFDLAHYNYNEIYNNKYINRKVSIKDYDFKFNKNDTKIYNIINNNRTKEIANILDINKFNTLNKPILLIVGDSRNKILSFEKFLSNNLENLIKLSKTYDIIISPHPRCAGADIYRRLKKLNSNFTINLNITFITAIDKSDIILSYGLSSIIDNYVMWTNKKLLLIYNKKAWYEQNHKKFQNTDKILNNKCCVIQHETNINIISGINDALKMDEKTMLQHRKKFLNNYFFIDEKDGHKKFLKNILQNRKILIKE